MATPSAWDTAGKYAAGKLTGKAQRAAKLKAARQINGMAIKVESEMKARKLIR